MALTALFTGLTGLRANSMSLDVTGNNLANLNTTGYKGQLLGFKDLVYQTMSTGSAPTGGLGGKNPSQVGFGVGVGSVATVQQQGGVTPTGRSLDAAIQGNGFFTLSNGVTTVYSRAGAFGVDAGGFLVDPNTGFRVQRTGTLGEASATNPGFQTSGIGDIKVPFGASVAGVRSANVNMQGNLSTALAVGDQVTTAIQVYDSQSSPRELTVVFTKTAVNTFTASATIAGGTATVPATNIVFNNDGTLQSPATLAVSVTGIPGAISPQTITLKLGTPNAADGLTQFGGASTATAVTQDGTGAGALVDVSFDTDGVLQGLFSNGRNIPLAQLAIAGFNNESGLVRSGDNYFVSSPASGEALIGPGGGGGRGTIQGAALEGSNVEIAAEFARLIIAQRGFQVNARTITAANETLQELANIIR